MSAEKTVRKVCRTIQFSWKNPIVMVNVVAITITKIAREAVTVFSKLPGRRNLEKLDILITCKIFTYQNPSIFYDISYNFLFFKCEE
jgi:hypothetical protein